MSHFAEIDENNVVIRILVVPDKEENRGQEYLSTDLELGGRWIKTSYNNNIRGRYAGVGYIYNEFLDIFIYPKPFESWILNEFGEWNAPIQKPNNYQNITFIWNEQNLSWDEQEIILPYNVNKF